MIPEYNDNKVFYTPGDLVVVKHRELANAPVMLVKGKMQKLLKDKESDRNDSVFLGIKCIWFNKNQELQEAVFNTKDLELYS